MPEGQFNDLVLMLAMLPAVILFVNTAVCGLFMKTLFTKAGYKPGDAFIPLLNLYRVTQISGLPGWILIVLAFFSFPGLFIWRLLVITYLARAFEIKSSSAGLYVVIGVISFPIGCALIGHSAGIYLLDEEQVAKKHTQGFSAQDEGKKE